MKSIFPVGVIIDLDTCKDTTYKRSTARMAKIVGIMGFNTETFVLEPMDMPSISKSSILKDYIDKYLVYYFINNNIHDCDIYHNGKFGYLMSRVKVFDKDGTLFMSESNTVYLEFLEELCVKLDLLTLKYSITVDYNIRSDTRYRLNILRPYLDDLIKLFQRLDTGIRLLDGFLVISQEFKGNSLVMPQEAKFVVIYDSDSLNLKSISFSKDFVHFLSDEWGGVNLSSVKHIALSKEASVEQLIYILGLLNHAKGNRIRELESITKDNGCECASDFLYKHEDLVKELMDGIEVTVY